MKKYFTLVFALVVLTSLKGQQNTVYNFPQEKMYAHLNTSLLFPGESLFYKLYCLDKEKNNLSSLSTIAYVELLGASNEIVFKHRILLKDGTGFNDFFIPTTIPSGNYKFIAYTQWMQNTGLADVFEADVKVINPYLNEKLTTTNNQATGVNTRILNATNEENKTVTSFDKIAIELDKSSYNTREKVRLKLKSNIAELGYGTYSLSVRKVDEIPSFNMHKAAFLSSNIPKKNGILNPNKMLPPETEGYFLTGKVLLKAEEIPVADVDVSISIPGKDFYFTATTTGVDGGFSFIVDPEFPSESAIIQVLGENKDRYSIVLDTQPVADYSSLSFSDFEIDVSAKKAIVKRSVYNQIENGYYTVKPDTLKSINPANSFVRYEKGVTYNLDDYTRFPTMTEVFTEIMKIVYTTNDKKGNKVVKVVERKFGKATNDIAMLFIDGVFIPDHTTFLAFDATKVDYIKFIRNGYVFGQTDYQGVVLVTTQEKNYIPEDNESYITANELFVPKKQKQYFKQIYDTETAATLKRIPDYRLQLLWQPEFELKTFQQELNLFTSDIAGDYKVVLEGFTRSGNPISSETYFSVKD